MLAMNELVKNFEDTLVSDREFSHQLNQDVLTELFVESFSKLLPVIRMVLYIDLLNISHCL